MSHKEEAAIGQGGQRIRFKGDSERDLTLSTGHTRNPDVPLMPCRTCNTVHAGECPPMGFGINLHYDCERLKAQVESLTIEKRNLAEHVKSFEGVQAKYETLKRAVELFCESVESGE